MFVKQALLRVAGGQNGTTFPTGVRRFTTSQVELPFFVTSMAGETMAAEQRSHLLLKEAVLLLPLGVGWCGPRQQEWHNNASSNAPKNQPLECLLRGAMHEAILTLGPTCFDSTPARGKSAPNVQPHYSTIGEIGVALSERYLACGERPIFRFTRFDQ